MEKKTIFGKVANYKELHVYQKSEVLVLLTDVFCKRFLPLYGDRQVDQMNMAARCGKQPTKSLPRNCRQKSSATWLSAFVISPTRCSTGI